MIILSLELEGMSVDWCETRDQALERVSAALPDVVVMDYLMQGMSAASFVSRLNEKGFSGPLFICTGFDGDLGVEARVIHKPFDPDLLVSEIRGALSGSDASSTEQ